MSQAVGMVGGTISHHGPDSAAKGLCRDLQSECERQKPASGDGDHCELAEASRLSIKDRTRCVSWNKW